MLLRWAAIAQLAAVAATADVIHSSTPLVVGALDPNQVVTIGHGTAFYQNADIAVLHNATLHIQGELHLTGQIYVTDTATLLVDGGELHIGGNDTNVWVDKSGHVAFRAGALLHYVQSYVAQHNLIAWGNGSFSFRDTRMEADGSIQFVYLRERASYEAVNLTTSDWTTWYMWETTSLLLDHVNFAGDIVFYDSPTMRFVATDVVMPWLHFGQGARVDVTFPTPAWSPEPVTLTIDALQPGFSGIPWHLSLEGCRRVAWGINPYPGSDVTIRESALAMVMLRLLGSGTYALSDFPRNGQAYADLTFPLDDRLFRLVNTSVRWWKVDAEDDVELTATGITFSEMMVRDDARADLARSICEGQTIHLGATHNAHVRFSRGEVWSYVSVWDNAVMVLEDSLVDPEKGQFTYQTRNIAHGSARLFGVNTAFRVAPEAVDQAVVMVASLTPPPAAVIGQTVEVMGTAWSSGGPASGVAFERYEIHVAAEGSESWSLVAASTAPVRDGLLARWDTASLSAASYRLRLTVSSRGDGLHHPTSAYPAYRSVRVDARPRVRQTLERRTGG